MKRIFGLTVACIIVSSFYISCFGKSVGSSLLDGRWMFEQGYIEFNSRRGTFKMDNPYMPTDMEGKFKEYEAANLTFINEDEELELTFIFRKDGTLLVNINGTPDKIESYIMFKYGSGTNADTLGGTWKAEHNGKKLPYSFEFDNKAKRTTVELNGKKFPNLPYSVKPFIMLECKLYADFDDPGYSMLMPVTFVDERTFTTPDDEVYVKVR